MSEDVVVVGIDPAPSKASVVCRGGAEFEVVRAEDLPGYIGRLVDSPGRLLIAWDAPLSFDGANGYSDRPVDKETRAWMNAQVRAGRLAQGAVSVLPFAGCPHWAISCAALGMPFGIKPPGLQLADTPADGDKLVIEVHPAVTLARWWVGAALTEPMPKYKGANKADAARALAAIKAGLPGVAIPEAAVEDDDHLDAWVAWKMATDFDAGEAAWVGSPGAGGYVLPVSRDVT